MTLCEQILSFIETPQYLRKRLFKLSPELRFAGILPPLQSPNHSVPSSISQCKVGDLRDGVVLTSHGGLMIADVGLERQMECKGKSSPGERITIRITELGRNLAGEVVDRTKISIYWGYRVTRAKFGIRSLLEQENFKLKIGTSRYGKDIQDEWTKISNSLGNADSVLIAFGSPRKGLREILRQEGKGPEQVFDYFVNTIPRQGTATVRTEEALLVTLGLLNLMVSR